MTLARFLTYTHKKYKNIKFVFTHNELFYCHTNPPANRCWYSSRTIATLRQSVNCTTLLSIWEMSSWIFLIWETVSSFWLRSKTVSASEICWDNRSWIRDTFWTCSIVNWFTSSVFEPICDRIWPIASRISYA